MDGPKSVEELKRLLQEAEQRVEEAKRRLQEDRQPTEEAKRERQEELTRLLREAEQRMEEADRELQEEQMRLIRELEQRLEEALQRRQRAEREREIARQRADEAKKRADEAERGLQEDRKRADEAKKRADEAERKIRPTTLDEYIAACHTSVFSRFTIKTHPKLTSMGSIANPPDKWCPKNLRPWSDFLDQQRLIFATLYDSFPTDRRAFENLAGLAGVGKRISERPVANERALEYFLLMTVEDPLRLIIRQLKLVEEVGRAFQIGDRVIFKSQPHALSDVAEEVVDREMQDPAIPAPTPEHRICVYRSDNAPSSQYTLVYVSEQKSPCKLTAPHLRLGLRPMDIFKEVVNRQTIPTSTDPEARFQYHAEKLAASAVTQTYHYMIESGLEYGLLTTGEAIVFLKIDWDEPETLYYHLAEPGPEVSAHPNNVDVCSVVGQHLAFMLMALGSPGERRVIGQEERQRAMRNLRTWADDFESTLRSIPENERLAPSDSSPGYEPTTYKGVDRTPQRRAAKSQIDEGLLREDGSAPSGSFPGYEPTTYKDVDRTPRRPATKSQIDEGLLREDGSAPKLPCTPSSTGGTRRSQRLAHQPLGGEPARQYCTQNCLLGMVRGGLVDLKCPNVALHCKNKSCAPAGARHPVNHEEWLRLLWKQLEHSLDDGIRPLDEGGARGVLFQVTLLAYGYTLVSKGTVRAFIKDLEHEAAVYERLKPVQGVHVPVFLGAIDLGSMNKTYYYDHRVYVVHMTLLSWGGCRVDTADDMNKSLEDEAIRSLRAMHQEGVIHKDVRLANLLFNSETNGVMVIDFERALLLEPPQRPSLAQLVPKKRAWKSEAMDTKKKVTGGSSKRNRADRGFSEDIWLASTAFMDWNARRGI